MAANTYVALKEITINALNTDTIIFDSIPSTYTDLRLVVSANIETGTNNVFLNLNSDYTVNTGSSVAMLGNGTTASGAKRNNDSVIFVGLSQPTSSVQSLWVIDILDYASASTSKSIIWRYSDANVRTQAGLARKVVTAPVTSLQFVTSGSGGGNWAIGSTFNLYGITAEAPGSTPKATGGVLSQDSTHYYHTFFSTSLFVPNQTLSCDYLIVAGGGGGGNNGGGGGGAGGYRTFTSQSIAAGSYTVSVGAAGAGSLSGTVRASSGVDSAFNSSTSTGGGGGTSRDVNLAGSNGGSGGGGANSALATLSINGGLGNTPSTSPSQGNNGGSTPAVDGGANGAGAGGGGAVSSGSAPTNFNTASVVGGVGGDGSNSLSSWATVTGTGVGGYYAGGGGGAPTINGTAGAGGLGGGGAGGIPGAVSTGSGGGGGSQSYVGQNGGSGIVIIRYAK